MITVIARFKIKPEKEQEALAQLESLTQSVEANEPGVEAYLCHRSKDDPAEIVFFEVYKDKEAFGAHQATPHMDQMKQVFAGLFNPPVKIERLERIAGFKR